MDAINRERVNIIGDRPKPAELLYLVSESNSLLPIFEELQSLKQEIGQAKKQALAEIDARYADRLHELREQYVFILSMSRN